MEKSWTKIILSSCMRHRIKYENGISFGQSTKERSNLKREFKLLKRQGLVEGRYPNIFVSFKVADIVGQKAAYICNRGLEDDICKQLIVKALEAMGEASKREIMEVLENACRRFWMRGRSQKKYRIYYRQ